MTASNRQTAQYLRRYNAIRDGLVANVPASQRAASLARFDSDPRAQKLRKMAGLVPLSTRQGDVRKAAEETRKQGIKDTAQRVIKGQRAESSTIPLWLRDMGASLVGSANDAMLGIPARAAAALSGTPNDLMQEYADQLGQRAPVTNFLGTLATALGTGTAVVGGARALAGAAVTQAPRLANWVNVFQRLTQLEKGKRAANVARVSGAGAVGGATDAAIRDRSIAGGAALGAIGAPVVHGAVRGTVGAAKGIRNLAGFEPVEQILTKYVKTPVEEIQRKMNGRAKQGLPSSIYEVLPLADRQRLDDAIGKMPATGREYLASTVRQRTENMVWETTEQVKALTQPRMKQTQNQIASDLATSRGDIVPSPAEIRAAKRASRSSLDMETLAAAEARNIMRPHDTKQVFKKVTDLFPQHPVQTGKTVKMVESSPEISGMIDRAAGLLRNKSDPLTVKEVTDILSRLRKRANGEEGDIAREAIDHITDLLEREHPDIASAVQEMRSQWHHRLASMEGMMEGARTRLRENAPPTRETRNAYETAGGRTGRVMGQSAQLERDLFVAPDASLSAMNEIAGNPTTQRAISQNLGTSVGEDIAAVARTQTDSARSLGRLAVEREGGPHLDGAKLLQNLMMLSPNTLPSTKAWALTRLLKGSVHIPERQGKQIVDMLFSQNPTQISRAVKTLDELGEGQFIRNIGRDLAIGAMSAQGATPNDFSTDAEALTHEQSGEPDYSQMSDEELLDLAHQRGEPDYSQMSDEELLDLAHQRGGGQQTDLSEVGGDSPYASALQQIYQTESPEIIDLIQRVKQQESGGDQSAVSSAGAIGVMQVMPATAPEAAQLAGLQWDEDAYRNDAAYNELLGIAYLSEMLRKYDGDVHRALAAYNAGPGRVDDALSMHDASWLSNLPRETQDYVARVG